MLATQTHNIEATYRGLIIPIMRDVTIRLSQGLVFEAWLANKTLYESLLSDCKPDVQKKFTEVNQAMKQIQNIKGIDSYHAIILKGKLSRQVLMAANFELYGVMVAALEKNGYLDRKNTYITENDFKQLDDNTDSEIEALPLE